MALRNAETPEGNRDLATVPSISSDQFRYFGGNSIIKSGPLFLSSKGIGWTSWKKRWFILTKTSLVFFRSDPNALPPRGAPVESKLGGVDLNSSGSVVVRADRKLLTIFFPDGNDGQAFTLKAETSEDLYGWKTALENALAEAPSGPLHTGQNGLLSNAIADALEGSCDQCQKEPVKSLIVSKPSLFALEDADGSPSFLERALRFIEECGIRVEGILRQSADVEEVERRILEYEQGKDEFLPDEDAHLVADCIKHVLRAMPSPPVPASCCTLLLEAFRSERDSRVSAMKSVICTKFPETNKKLLQRILKMMLAVVSHKSDNRMSTPAVAACMAPLLLRPLLAGDCQFEDDFCMAGDSSVQLLQAAAAANHAQAIIIILLDDYHNIFVDHSPLEIYSETDGSYSEDDELTDDHVFHDDSCENDDDDDHYQDEYDHGTDAGNDTERTFSGTMSEISANQETESDYDNESEIWDSTDTTKAGQNDKANEQVPELPNVVHPVDGFTSIMDDLKNASLQYKTNCIASGDTNEEFSVCNSKQPVSVIPHSAENRNTSATSGAKPKTWNEADGILHFCPSEYNDPQVADNGQSNGKYLNKCLSTKKSLDKSGYSSTSRRRAVWGRTAAKKNLSMESIDFSLEDEALLRQLEDSKLDLEKKIAREAEQNSLLQTNLERRKETLYERRLALEQEVVRLQNELQRERDLRAALEAGLGMVSMPVPTNIDSKIWAELEEIANAEADVSKLKERVSYLHYQLSQEHKTLCPPKSEASVLHPQNSGSLTLEETDLSATVIPDVQPRESTSFNGYGNRQDDLSLRNQFMLKVQQASSARDVLIPAVSNSNFLKKMLQSSRQPRVINIPSPIATCAGLSTSMTSFQNQETITSSAKHLKFHGSPTDSSPWHAVQSNFSKADGGAVVGSYPGDRLIMSSWNSNDASSSPDAMLTVTAASGSTKKSRWLGSTLSSEEALTCSPAVFSKKSAGKAEVSSALTRLTNRFNFKKERRSQSVELSMSDPSSNGSVSVESPPSVPARTNSR